MKAAYEGDPAAKNVEEIAYRIANRLYRAGVPMVPRIITEHAHSRTHHGRRFQSERNFV